MQYLLADQEIAQAPDFISVIRELSQQFSNVMKQVLFTIDATVIDISRVAYISLILLGILLYYSRIERRLGKDLIKGGIILAILSEFIFPLIGKP